MHTTDIHQSEVRCEESPSPESSFKPSPDAKRGRRYIHRLRPVLMTALVASFGFISMALSTSQGAEAGAAGG